MQAFFHLQHTDGTMQSTFKIRWHIIHPFVSTIQCQRTSLFNYINMAFSENVCNTEDVNILLLFGWKKKSLGCGNFYLTQKILCQRVQELHYKVAVIKKEIF